MQKIIKLNCFLISLLLIICSTYISTNIYAADFDTFLNEFPKSYRTSLTKLHNTYPNWVFIPDEIDYTFKDAVNAQDYLFYKLTNSKYNSYRSMRQGCYDWSSKKFVEVGVSWYGASREVIAYYMDPRNFLNEDNIYIFMSQSFDSLTQTVNDIEKLVNNTFLDNKITDVSDAYYGKSYAQLIFDAAKLSSVNALVLTSAILQEQGINGTALSNGAVYEGATVYNFFNFGAFGETKQSILLNGKKFAYSNKWFTASEAIIDGAKMYCDDYLKKGQNTFYYKDYNVCNPNDLWHQYASNVENAIDSARFLKNSYSQHKDLKLTFRIPVFKDMPQNISALPSKSSKLNNYYLENIEATGLTPSFNRYNYEYNLSVNGNSYIYLKLPAGASYVGNTTVSLKKGENKVKLCVKSQTGYTRDYIINVSSSKACKLYVNTNGSCNVKRGDSNNDNKISITDLSNVRLHLLGVITLDNNNYIGADTNSDGRITIVDLANIRLHLLKIITLK